MDTNQTAPTGSRSTMFATIASKTVQQIEQSNVFQLAL